MDSELLEEVDVTEILKKTDTSGITRVSNLAELLSIFGYSPDDRIDRREICVMYDSVKKAMEDEIDRLAHSAGYSAAKDMRGRLSLLRREFDALQVQGVRNSQGQQTGKFEEATKMLKLQMSERNASMETESNSMLDQVRQDQLKAHEIQRENLEVELMRIPRPRMKYSKRCIELMKAEHELIRLAQYDDAKKVNAMLKRVKPLEERRFYQKFDEMLEERRALLHKNQSVDLVRLDEKLKGLQWNDVRVREKELSVGQQRIKNHHKDMGHAHTLERMLRPEMSVKPSALWLKRKNFNTTSASLRGQQLFESAKGFAKGEDDAAVFCETLTDKHNFHLPLLDTLTLRESY